MTRRLTPLFVPAAVALGHLSSYALVHPDAAERSAALVGHGHLAPLVAVGLLSAVFGLGLIAAERRNGVTVTPRYGTLVRWGVAGFWLVEVVERLVHGHLDRLLAEPAVAVGLVLQVVVAALLWALARLAVGLGAALPAPAPGRVAIPSTARRWTVTSRTLPVLAVADAATWRRGPPLLVRA